MDKTQRIKYTIEMIVVILVIATGTILIYLHTQSQGIKTPVVHPTISVTPATQQVASEADNGKTIQIHEGTMFVLMLHSLYWQNFDSSDTTVLKFQNSSLNPDPSVHIPGTGAGLIVVVYQALRTGTSVISASRTTCGEALACGPSDSHYALTVEVVR